MPGSIMGVHETEKLADVTNGADDTYYYYAQMSGYKYGGMQLVLSGGSGSVTVTMEASVQVGGDLEKENLTYVDKTNDIWGSANFTASVALTEYLGKMTGYTWVRFKVVASTGAANDADWRVDFHKSY